MKIQKIAEFVWPRHQFILILILPILIFWLMLFGLGYPPPNIDDLAFTGAAINIAKHGDFFNPLLALWSDRLLDRFYIQPPFHQYTLAGWLWLFGISTQSLLLFQCLCYSTFSIFTALIFRYYKFSRVAAALTVICYAFWMLNTGLRPEALGMAFMAVGLWSLTRDTPTRYFFGFTFLGASILTIPLAMAYAIPLGLAIAIANYYSSPKIDRYYFLKRIGAWIAAFLLNLTLFFFCIDFNLSLFLQDMAWHSSFRRQPLHQAISAALWLIQIGYGELIYGSLFLLYFCLCLRIFIKRKEVSKKLLWIVFVLNISLLLNLLIYASTIISWFNFFCWVSVALILDEIASKYKPNFVIPLLITLVFFINQSINIITLAGTHSEPSSSYQAIKDYVREHPNKTYAIDSVAARFVFNYNLPQKSVDWNFSNRAPQIWPTSLSQKPPHMTWLISPIRAAVVPELPDYPKVRIFGRTFNSIPSHPYQVMIVE